MPTSADAPWTPARLTDLATAYWPAAALAAAVELQLFDALPDSAAGIARQLGFSLPHTEALLDALSAIGLLTRSPATAPAHYALAPTAAPLLARDSPASLLNALKYNADLMPLWLRLGATVRTGTPPAHSGFSTAASPPPAGSAAPASPAAHLGADPEKTRRFVLGMESKAMAFAPSLVPALDRSGVQTLLDVGSGPGTTSRMLARRHPELRVTLFDLPPILDVTRQIVAGSPEAGRFTFVAGDYRRDPLPDLAGHGFDAALYAGALHQESPASAAVVLAGIARSLRPGGRLLLVDLMLDPSRTAPVFSALFQLNMLLTTPAPSVPRVFDTAELAEILAGAGFTAIEARDLAPTPYRLVQATTAPRPG